jgi:ATP-binding cassette subfamily A (ABC1) protein 3
MGNYRIESYGISITTLEEVFLNINKEFKINIGNSDKVEHSDSEVMENLIKEEPVTSPRVSLNKVKESQEELSPVRLVGNSGLLENMKALMIKRVNIYKRDRSGLACEVIVPFLCVIVGCLISFVDLNPGSPNLTITPNLYPSQQRIVMNQNLVNSIGLVSPVEPSVFYNNLPGGSSFWAVTYDDTSSTDVT